MNKPNVLVQAVRSIKPEGGISIVAFQLAGALQDLGINVETVTCELPAGTDRLPAGKILEIKSVGWLAKRLHGYLKVNLTVILFSIFASRILRKRSRHGITLSHGDSFAGDIYVAHSCHWAAIHAKIKHGEKRWIFNPMHWFVLAREAWLFRRNRYRYIIAVSKNTAKEYQHYHRVPQERIKIISNGVDIKRFSPEQREEVRQQIFNDLKLSDNSFLLLFAGNEFRRKGLELLIRALPDIRTAGQETALIVLGNDDPEPFKSIAEKRGVAEKIHFLGARNDVERFMAAADLFVFPTNYEAFPLVVLEAMSCGTPVLATQESGIIECLKDDVNGVFIKRDPEDIAEKISTLLRDPAKRKHMGTAARATAEKFSWDIIAGRYLTVIQDVAREKQTGVSTC